MGRDSEERESVESNGRGGMRILSIYPSIPPLHFFHSNKKNKKQNKNHTHPLTSHLYPLSSIHIHSHPFTSTPIHSYPLTSTQIQYIYTQTHTEEMRWDGIEWDGIGSSGDDPFKYVHCRHPTTMTRLDWDRVGSSGYVCLTLAILAIADPPLTHMFRDSTY